MALLGAGTALGMALMNMDNSSASCDPVEALHAVWMYLTVERKELLMRQNMKQDILRVRDEFKLRNLDIDMYTHTSPRVA